MYKLKYLKYKNKYLAAKHNQRGGGTNFYIYNLDLQEQTQYHIGFQTGASRFLLLTQPELNIYSINSYRKYFTDNPRMRVVDEDGRIMSWNSFKQYIDSWNAQQRGDRKVFEDDWKDNDGYNFTDHHDFF